MAILGADDRVLVLPQSQPWKFAGRWALASGDVGSGVLLGEKYVLTAYHVFQVMTAGSSFSPAYSSVNGTVTTPFGTVAFDPAGPNRGDVSGGNDIALVRTSANTDIAVKDIPGIAVFLRPQDAVGEDVSSAGYPGDLANSDRMYGLAGTVQSAQALEVPHAIAQHDLRIPRRLDRG